MCPRRLTCQSQEGVVNTVEPRASVGKELMRETREKKRRNGEKQRKREKKGPSILVNSD